MTWVNVALSDALPAYRPGESLEAEAEWELDGDGSALELRLCWRIESPSGSPDPVVVRTERLEGLDSKGRRKIRVELPDGPWSFEGKLFSVEWFVEVASGDHISRKARFVLSPTGEPIRTRADAGADVESASE